MSVTKVTFPTSEKPSKLLQWKIREGTTMTTGRVLFSYQNLTPDGTDSTGPEKKFRATQFGKLVKQLLKADDIIQSGDSLFTLEGCQHPTVMKDLCAECGIDLREERSKHENNLPTRASVPMVHSIPELKVTPELAEKIGKEDVERLLRDKKLALLVDLDQTIVHTTNDNVPPNMKDVYHYQLYGRNSPWYHTRLRPNTRHFLVEMSNYYELHVITFGARMYAHKVTSILDTDGVLFSHRILSRDECFDPLSKTANLKALFPCGDDMVCIIDDREDVWQGSETLVQVKPYHFFRNTGDIHAPRGFDKQEDVTPPAQALPEIDEPEMAKTTEVSVENGEVPEKNENEKTEDTQEIKENKPVEIGKQTDDKLKEKTKESEVSKSEEKTNESEERKSEEKNKETGESKSEEQNKETSESKSEEKKKESDEKTEQKEESAGKEVENENKEEFLDEDHDDYLLYLEDILKRIHEEFYKDTDKGASKRSLKDVIPRVRAKVLKGLRITFSGLVPTHQKLEQSRAYRVAKAFGAQVYQDLVEETTHLVAIRPGTVKVNMARKNGKIKIVNPEWLWTCAERWEHVEERLFPLTPKVRGSRIPPPHCSSPEQIESSENKKESFANSINPLLSLSREEIDNMDKEVDEDMEDLEMDENYDVEGNEASDSEEAIESGDDDDNEIENRPRKRMLLDDEEDWFTPSKKRKDKGSSSSSSSSNSEEEEEEEEDIVTRFRRGEDLPDDLDLGDSQASIDDLNNEDLMDDSKWNEMGAALEREFLSD